MQRFEYINGEELKEHIGCKLYRKGDTLKTTQTILIKNLEYTFYLKDILKFNLLEELESILVNNETHDLLKDRLKYCQSSIGKLLHLMGYRIIKIQNIV